MIEFSSLWMLWWFDITCKALLLGTVAYFAILLFRLRDPNIVHRVWTGVLGGMCCLPMLVLVTPRLPLPNWLQLSQVALNAEQSPTSDAATTDDSRVDFVSGMSPVADSLGKELLVPRTAPQYEATQNSEADTVEVISEEPRIPPLNESASRLATFKNTLSSLAVAAMLGHVAISVFLLLRLFTGLWLSKRMIDRATPVIASEHGLPENIRMLQSNEISVPATIGFLKPQILMPSSWIQWSTEKTRSVLLHEQAHVRRADWLVTLVSEFNCAIHWFNPLSWIIRKRLADLAELNCDDAVLEARGDRAVYATHLIEVATELAHAEKRYLPPRQSIAMARKPMVEVRIDAILDDSRQLARRLGRAGVAALFLLFVPIVLLAAALGPINQNEAQADNQADQPNQKSSVPENAIQESKNIRYVYSGQVLTPDGKPSVGAKVRLVYWVADETQGIREEPDAITDSLGKFRFEMARSDFHLSGHALQPWQSAWLAVTQSGFGLTCAPAVAFEETGQAVASFEATSDAYLKEQLSVIRDMSEKQGNTITLSKEVKLSGSLFDLEGQPVPDVNVTFIEAFGSAEGSLDAWLAKATQKGVEFDSTWELLPKRLGGPLAQKLISAAKSNADGEYTIYGLGENQVVCLAAQSPHIVADGIYCRTCDAKPFVMNVGVLGDMPIFGDQPSLVTTPSQPIKGTVIKKETGEGLSGVLVSSRLSMALRGPGDSRRTGSEFARAITDAEGKFVLYGLPRVDGNTLQFSPPLQSHALPRVMSVDTSGLESSAIELEVALTQGVLINGRITDQLTSQPLNSGFIYYLGSSDAEDGAAIANPGADYTVDGGRPDLDGKYSIVVPPGIGYIGFLASSTDYELSHDFPKGFAMLMNGISIHMSQSGPYFHALEKIDATIENGAISLPMTVRAGNVYEVRAVDSSDNSIQNGTCVGLELEPSWRRFSKGAFQIANLRAGDQRTVAFVSADQKWAGAMIVSGGTTPGSFIRVRQGDTVQFHRKNQSDSKTPQDINPITIKAKPAGTIKGRVVDKNGSPIANVRILGSGLPESKSQPSATTQPIATQGISITHPERGETVTDNEGKFVITGLIGGFQYELEGRVGDFFITQSGQLATDVLISAGETRDLGDVQMSSNK